MCTVAVLALPDGVLLAGNRDERLTRAAAIPPRRERDPAANFLAPRDPEEGGTWTAVNDRGVAFSLLNNYQASAGHMPADPLSRGRVVRAVVTCASAQEAERRIRHEIPLARVQPFVLVVARRRPTDAVAATINWDGEQLRREDLPLPAIVVSNAGDYPRAVKAREDAFANYLDTCADDHAGIDGLFAGHKPARGHYSICMHFPPFAATVSNTVIRIGPRRATMTYRAGSPCTSDDVRITELELA